MAEISREALELGLGLFEQFIYTERMAPEEKRQIIYEADRIGSRRAEEIREEFGNDRAEDILKKLGVSVVEEREGMVQEKYVHFAQFLPKAREIRLNEAALDRLGNHMERKQAREIILCHELYHYFEVFRWGKTSLKFKRSVRLFGRLPVRRQILPAAEIAANAFVRRMLELNFEPQKIEQFYWEKGEKC